MVMEMAVHLVSVITIQETQGGLERVPVPVAAGGPSPPDSADGDEDDEEEPSDEDDDDRRRNRRSSPRRRSRDRRDHDSGRPRVSRKKRLRK